MKKKLCLLIVSIMLIGLCGCMDFNSKNDSRYKGDRQADMMAYMENKYHEKFEFVAIGTNTWDTPYVDMCVNSERFPWAYAEITVRQNGSGTQICDNYSDFLMKERIEKELTPLAQQVYPECKIKYVPGGMNVPFITLEQVNSMTIQEYAEDSGSLSISIYVYSDGNIENKETAMDQFISVLKDNNIYCSVYIYYVKNTKSLDDITDFNRRTLLGLPTEKEWFIGLYSALLDKDFTKIEEYWSEF